MIRLGLRLSLGSGRSGLLRTALMGLGAAIGVLIVLASLSVPTVAAAQQSRAEARNPLYVPQAGGPARRTDGPGLHMIQIEDAIGTRLLVRIGVRGATPDSPLPPGLASYPAVGELIASPALQRLLADGDPRATERFPQRIVGTIDRAGLVAPDELRAYVGVADTSTHAAWHRVTGFGPAENSYRELPDRSKPAAGLLFTLFVLLPFAAFLATCARLSAAVRDRRLTALRLLGITARQAALVNAVETGVVTSGGALLGGALFAVLAANSEGWHIGRLHWHAADIAVSWPLAALVFIATVVFAMLVAVLASRPARLSPLRAHRDRPARRPSRWRATPLGGGLLLLTAAVLAKPPGDNRMLLALPALPLIALGVPLAVPILAHSTAGLILRSRRAPCWLELAAARLRHSPGIAQRVVASLTVMVFVAGLAWTSLDLLDRQGRFDLAEWTVTVDSGVRQAMGVDSPTITALRDQPGVQAAQISSLETLHDEPALLVASCADLLAMYIIDGGPACHDGETYRLTVVEHPSIDIAPGAKAQTPDGLTVTAPQQQLRLRARHSLAVHGAVLVTRSSPLLTGHPLHDDERIYVIAADEPALERAARLIAHRQPGARMLGGLGAEHGLDTPLLVTIAVVGLLASLILGMGAFTTAAIDRTLERRRDSATLAVVGAPTRIVVASEIAFVAMPLVLGMLTATLGALAVGAALASIAGAPLTDGLPGLGPTFWFTAGAVLAGLLLATGPAMINTRITAESLRRA
jgi:hypothetical protein